MSESNVYYVEGDRRDETLEYLGMCVGEVYVRAISRGKWGPANVAELDDVSLQAWLRSDGDVSDFAMDFIMHLMGRGE